VASGSNAFHAATSGWWQSRALRTRSDSRWTARACALVCTLLLPLAACKRDGPEPPSPVVVAFYSWRVASRTTGAPTAVELQQFAPLLSDTLTALLRAAGALRDREAARAPDEKPPFVEGDLYSSLLEGPTKFSLVRDTVAARQGKTVVAFTYIVNGDSYSWTDTVLVGKKKIGKKKAYDVIEDVLYGGAGEFGNHGSLRQNLERALTAPR
jgi:hypothetical protein